LNVGVGTWCFVLLAEEDIELESLGFAFDDFDDISEFLSAIIDEAIQEALQDFQALSPTLNSQTLQSTSGSDSETCESNPSGGTSGSDSNTPVVREPSCPENHVLIDGYCYASTGPSTCGQGEVLHDGQCYQASNSPDCKLPNLLNGDGVCYDPNSPSSPTCTTGVPDGLGGCYDPTPIDAD